MKKILVVVMSLMLIVAFTACGNTEEEQVSSAPAASSAEDTAVNSEQAIGQAVSDYLVNEVGKDYEKADASIPVIKIISIDESNPDDILVKGCFEIYNYNIDGDTLKTASGGDHSGCLHLKANDDGTYTVTSFDQVEDGAGYEESAKKIFGDDYDAYAAYESDDKAKAEKRLQAVSEYVKAKGISCTKYQDEGWDPVDLQL